MATRFGVCLYAQYESISELFLYFYMSYWMLDPQLVFLHTLTMVSSFEDFNEERRTVWHSWYLTKGS